MIIPKILIKNRVDDVLDYIMPMIPQDKQLEVMTAIIAQNGQGKTLYPVEKLLKILVLDYY